MNAPTSGGEIIKSSQCVKMSILLFLSVAFFYLGMHFSDGYQQLIFFSDNITDSRSRAVSLSSNFKKSFDISLINDSSSDNSVPNSSNNSSIENLPVTLVPPTPPAAPPPPPLPTLERFGIVDENGTMTDDFEVGIYDRDVVESWGNASEAEDGDSTGPRVRVRRFPLCPESLRDFIPCMDNVEAIMKLKSTMKGERFERHCPEVGRELNCLVPAPKRYKTPIPWPRSRDEVWYSNVPHTRLVEDKGGQNWIRRDKDKFKFPGGGTQFIHGADQYLDQISQMIPNIAFGRHTRVALDVGCGVASFGAYLLSRNVITLSIAPKDVHENQIQFALERGVPAMVAAFATRRLPYPSQAFDLIHCSRCRVNWTRDDGILLLEVNRMMRAGGYFAWAAQPVYKHEESLEEQWKVWLWTIHFPGNDSGLISMSPSFPSLSEDCLFISICMTSIVKGIPSARLCARECKTGMGAWPTSGEVNGKNTCQEMVNYTTRLCWELVKKEGYIAIWQKPLNNSCYLSRDAGTQPPICDPDDDQDKVWYVNLKSCIARLPDNEFGANVTPWPARLQTPPERLQSIHIDAYISRKELFKAESKYWNEIIESYVRALHWKKFRLRNVMDMRAGFGGFAAALINQKLACWVLNVVPVSGPNTLPVIYDRGLIGVMHDWCEPFDTYPRTYDLLHAAGLFSVERKRCNVSSIMLEMDRMLRPGGRVYIRDSLSVIDDLYAIARAMGWHASVRDTSEGPHASYKILTCDKHLLH